jgi:hypothetical protein
MYKDLEENKYHCFTDNNDDWVKSNEDVKHCIESWKKEGYTNFRVYTCEWNEEEGIYDDIDCIYSKGEFPL